MTKRKPKQKIDVQVTGRSVAYIQDYGKRGKLGKPKPVVITTVRPRAAKPRKK